MTTALIRLAHSLASNCVTLLAPEAVALTGSAARGEADEASDLDLVLFYEQLPREEALEQVRQRLRGSEPLFRVCPPEGGSAIEAYYVHGVKCDFAHIERARWIADTAEVLEQHNPDSPMQKALAGILDAVPLHGPALIRELQAAAAAYPAGLAAAMARKHLSFYPPWVLERQTAARDEPLLYYELLTGAVSNLLGLLAGLNRVYHWGEIKRLSRFMARLRIAPERLEERVRNVLRDPPGRALPVLHTLVEETFALVAEHLPEVDLSAARERYRRPFGS